MELKVISIMIFYDENYKEYIFNIICETQFFYILKINTTNSVFICYNIKLNY